MRIIDADALQEDFIKRCYDECDNCDYSKNEKSWEGCRLIDLAPTVPLSDFKEGYKQAIIDGKTNFSRPQGEWVGRTVQKRFEYGYLTTHKIVCSVCGGSGEDDEDIPQCWKFCPNCGAAMTGENTDS